VTAAIAEYQSHGRGPCHTLHIVVGRSGEVYARLYRESPLERTVSLLRSAVLIGRRWF
jgi:hypothetical protein